MIVEWEKKRGFDACRGRGVTGFIRVLVLMRRMIPPRWTTDAMTRQRTREYGSGRGSGRSSVLAARARECYRLSLQGLPIVPAATGKRVLISDAARGLLQTPLYFSSYHCVGQTSDLTKGA